MDLEDILVLEVKSTKGAQTLGRRAASVAGGTGNRLAGGRATGVGRASTTARVGGRTLRNLR
jgi:hypothetical protein